MPNPVGTLAEAIAVARNTLVHAPPDVTTGRTQIVPTLRQYAEECTRLKVQIRSSLLSGEQTRGLVLRYTDRVVVHVCADLNTCWTRFVVCKELMHLLVDVDQRSFTTDIVHQLSCMLLGSQIGGAQLDSEGYAFFAALEYMLPHTHRPNACNDVRTAMSIAEQFKVPRVFVEFFYSDDCQKLIRQFNG